MLMLKNAAALLGQSLSHLVFPALCDFCDSPIDGSGLCLCPRCRDAIRRIRPPFCVRCGREIYGELPEEYSVCGTCIVAEPSYSMARYAVRYEGALRRALIAFKYYNALHLGNLLARLLLEAFDAYFKATKVDGIVPVPLHWRKLYSRGYNQTVILAANLAAATGIPLYRRCLQKLQDRPPQVGLSRTKRLQNVRGSFSIPHTHAIRGRSILLVDDVATTGATVAEAARTIVRAGASEVNVLVLAFRGDFPHAEAPRILEAAER